VQQLSKSIALYGARDGMKIRCNSVHPGVIRTRMLDQIYETLASVANISKDEAEQLSLQHVPFR
jgi:NAD(P)-dependent dehydrogenase (short-subunit alcohol dehydrogenase family)